MVEAMAAANAMLRLKAREKSLSAPVSINCIFIWFLHLLLQLRTSEPNHLLNLASFNSQKWFTCK